MRFLPGALCASLVFASGAGSASAAPNFAAQRVDILGPLVHGDITGANGHKLDCSNTTAEIHADGKKVGTYPTTPDGKGGCAFSERLTGISSSALITSCAGKVSFGDMNERLNVASTRTVTNGHEFLGTIGSHNVYSTFASGGPGGVNGLNVTVGTEQ